MPWSSVPWPVHSRTRLRADCDRCYPTFRRGKQLLVWLGPANVAAALGSPALGAAAAPAATPEAAASEPAVLTVHLKMTGQLFVVAAGAPQDRCKTIPISLSPACMVRNRQQ